MPGILAFNVKCTAVIAKTIDDLFKRDLGRGFHLVRDKVRVTQNQRERHGKAAGVGRPNQFFRIGAGLPFKSTAIAVRVSR
jgi:hypothetical protein